MRSTGADVELLTEAICNLPAVMSIRRVSLYELENPPLAGRELFGEIGILTCFDKCPEVQATVVQVISIVLGTIIRSKRQLKTLELQPVPYSLSLSQTSTSRRLSRTSTPPQTLAQDQLDQLHLSKLTSFTLIPPAVRNMINEDATDECPFLWLTPLVSRMKSLRKLCLGAPLGELWVEPFFLPFLAYTDATLPQLNTLEIYGIYFRHQELTSLFRKVAQTLEKFSCMHCLLVAGSYLDVIKTLVNLPVIVHARLSVFDTNASDKQRWERIEKTPEQFKESLSTYLNSPEAGSYDENIWDVPAG